MAKLNVSNMCRKFTQGKYYPLRDFKSGIRDISFNCDYFWKQFIEVLATVQDLIDFTIKSCPNSKEKKVTQKKKALQFSISEKSCTD